MSDNKPPASLPTLSLYDDLLGANSGASISAAPVMYKKEDDDVKAKLAKIQQSLNAARPQPKRPQQTQAKGFRPKIPSSGAKLPTDSSSSVARTSSPVKKSDVTDGTASGLRSSVRGGIEDWVGDDEWYEGPKRERGGRKKRKKDKQAKQKEDQNWDAVYDPTRPTSYEAYKDSDERIRELEDWMAVLRGKRRRRDSSMRSSRSGSEEHAKKPMNRMFAPPGMNFAPPTTYDEESFTESPSKSLPSDATGDDAFANRMRMSGMAAPPRSPTPRAASSPPPPPPPAAPQFAPGVVLSAEPVRYTLPPPPPDLPANEEELAAALSTSTPETAEPEEEPAKSSRPGQKGFAARYMAKHGYKKGQGLGASGTGIINALSVKVEKQKKTFDAEGNAEKPKATLGKIVGGKKKAGTEDTAMSNVVRCVGMLEGRDVEAEMRDGGLMEELGQGCSERYGNIERVYVHQPDDGGAVVFLKFTAQISALRAIAALNGGQYGGNTVKAGFWDEEKFEKGIYV